MDVYFPTDTPNHSIFEMHFSSLSPKHAAILIPLILSSLVTAYPSNQKRQDGSDDSCDDEAPTSDGPTSDKSAGLGVEFECSAIIFASPECSAGDTNQAKGKVVGGRKDTNWELTTDTTQGIAGRLTAEYILDGTVIKIGDGTASTAAAAASSDLVRINLIFGISDTTLIELRSLIGSRMRTCPKTRGI